MFTFIVFLFTFRYGSSHPRSLTVPIHWIWTRNHGVWKPRYSFTFAQICSYLQRGNNSISRNFSKKIMYLHSEFLTYKISGWSQFSSCSMVLGDHGRFQQFRKVRIHKFFSNSIWHKKKYINFMNFFSSINRSLFLRFVWGRTRLPRSIADFRGRDFVLQVSLFSKINLKN